MNNKNFPSAITLSLEFLFAEENSSLLRINLLGIVFIFLALGIGVWAAIVDILPLWVVRVLLFELVWVLLLQITWIVFRARVVEVWSPWIAAIRDASIPVRSSEFLSRTYPLLRSLASFGVVALTLSIVLWIIGVKPEENLTIAGLFLGDDVELQVEVVAPDFFDSNWLTTSKGIALDDGFLVNDADSPTHVIQNGDRLRLQGLPRTRESNSERLSEVAMLTGENAGQRGWLSLSSIGHWTNSSLELFPYHLRDLSFDLRYLRTFHFYLLGLSFVLVSYTLRGVIYRFRPSWVEKHRLQIIAISSFIAMFALQMTIDGHLILDYPLLMVKIIISAAFSVLITIWDSLNIGLDFKLPLVGKNADDGLEVQQKLLYEPETLQMLSDLALDYRGRGLYLRAANFLEEILNIREYALGPEHLDTLNSRDNLAVVYGDMGRHEDAARLNKETVSLMERVLGVDHPTTLKSRNNLAISYLDLGKHDYAIALFRQTLTDRERVLGESHPETVNSRINLERALKMFT